MNFKRAGLLALLATAVVASGCTAESSNPTDTEKEKQLTNSDEANNAKLGTAFYAEMRSTEANQQGLIQKHPIPKLDQSLERQNLRKRYQYLNDQNNVHHVYLLSHGKVVSHYVAQGKVSSVNSKLTQPTQLVRCDRGSDGEWEELFNKDDQCEVPSPQLDGSYGTNGDGIFFFTTDGSYVEWNGEYVVSERPMNIQTPLTLTSKVNTSQ